MIRAALALCFAAFVPVVAQSTTTDPLAPISDAEWGSTAARHLLARAGFGGTPSDVERLVAMGAPGAVDWLVDYRAQPPCEVAIEIAAPEAPTAQQRRLSEQERRALGQQRRRADQRQMADLRRWWLERMVATGRPLEEKLTLFWHGHFASGQRTVRSSFALHRQNELLREHAVDYGALLRGIVRDAAMLRYLDNDSNRKGHPNENLARELLELFSMGEGCGYTEDDIREAARALTGYTFDRRTAAFQFVARAHDNGDKTIFGETAAFDGDDVPELILRRQETARFIAEKLLRFFVYDDPPAAIVDAVASRLRENNYRLAPVLRALFLSREFHGERARGSLVKSPVQLLVATIRALGLHVADYAPIASAAAAMGQDLFEPPDVRGWIGGPTWIDPGRILTRQNSIAALLRGPTLARSAAAQALAADPIGSPERLVDHVLDTLLVRPVDESTRDRLRAVLVSSGPRNPRSAGKRDAAARLRALLVLVTTLPEFQLT
ncbi:MAG: DUF1800 domain-containing protein [Planctomycetes bacterium]|nr:DUF1800 domain-containing protein [Planctomycetota bacterium]